MNREGKNEKEAIYLEFLSFRPIIEIENQLQ